MDVNRLIYDPIGRPRIPKENMNPARADWVLFKIMEGPPEGVKAGDYLTMIEKQREFDIKKIAKDSALGSSKRARVVADRENVSVEDVVRSPPVRSKRQAVAVQRPAATASRQQNAKTARPRLPSPIAVDDDPELSIKMSPPTHRVPAFV